MTGIRATSRAGHHAAAIAVSTVSSSVTATSAHGTPAQACGGWRARSVAGRAASQPTTPSTDPTSRGDDAHGGPVGDHHHAAGPAATPEGGEQAELALAALGDDEERGRRHETHEGQRIVIANRTIAATSASAGRHAG